MKRFISSVALICIATITNAQTEKGNFLIGGSASIQVSKLNDATSTSISLSPNISYFLANRFAAGLITPLSTSHGSSSSITSSSVSYAIGPTLRYYFPISDKWAIFPELDYYYQWSKSNSDLVGTPFENKTTPSVFRINAGLTYFVARNVGLEGILYYQNLNTDSSTGISVSGPTYGLRFGLQIYLLRNTSESAK